jgi:UDPglucose 6-dehydrogenase
MTTPVIGFAGMTHLGLNSAAACAARGFHTVCYAADSALIEEIAAGRLPVIEPGLPHLLAENAGRIRYTADAGELAGCDLVYIAADVPTDDRGASDLTGIRELAAAVGARLGKGSVLTVLCQVPPGFTRQLEWPAERLFYQVETLVFGRAVERALNPERIIIGCADPARELPPSYRELLAAFGCPVLPMRYESAELAKIAINCCLVASVTVANTLAELSERIGADWSEIAPALKLDRRIGQHAYLAPGLGIAGGNLERDLETVLLLALETGADAALVDAFFHVSRHRRDWVLRMLHAEVLAAKPDAVIGVLGLAYKEDTHSTKNSPALALLRHLAPWQVRVHDPVVPASAAGHARAVACGSALDVALGADALAIMTPWRQFRALTADALSRALRGSTVIDPYRVLDGAAIAAVGLDYLTLGVAPLRGAPGRRQHA